MNEPLVSIIILNYNGLKYLKECFDSLYELNYQKKELIFVDNNSNDKSVEFVKKNYKDVKIVQLRKNYGFAKGNNLGIPYTKGEYIILLNQDTVVDKHWLSELVKISEKSNKIGIVGSKIYYHDDKNEIFYAIGTSDEYGNSQNVGRYKRDNTLFNTQTKCFFVCGAALLIKRELYAKIKLFDPTYFMYYEDVDLCWRTIISGYDVVFAPKSYIYHNVDRKAKNNNKKRFLLEKNRLRTVLKNYEIKTLISILPKYFKHKLNIFYDYLRYNKRQAYDYLIINLKSLLWNIFHFKSLIKYRKRVQGDRRRSDEYLFKFMATLRKYIMKYNNLEN